MQKYFTKEITQPLKVIVLGLAIGLGVSFVSANWTPPMDGAAPGCTVDVGHPGCDAPINVSSTGQGKGGLDLGAKLYIHGLFGADNIYGAQTLKVGDFSTQSPDGSADIFTQLKLDVSNGYSGGGTDVLNLVASNSADHVGIVQNKPWVTFWNGASQIFGGINAGSATFNREDAQDQNTILQVNRAGNAGFIIDPGYTSTTGVDVTVNGRLKINDGTQGAGKVFASIDGDGQGAWANMPTIPIPDIKMVEESWSDINDGQSRSLNCPADYAPIAVTCDSDKDDGVDTCYIMDGGGAFDFNGRQTGNDSGYVTPFTSTTAVDYNFRGGKISPSNDNANIHMWLTCMRYKNYPVLAITTGNTPPPAPTPTTWHIASVQPSNSSASQCTAAYANAVSSHPTFTASEVAYYQIQDTMSGSGVWMNGTPPATPPTANIGLCITGSGIVTSQLPGGSTWASSTVGNVIPATNASPAKRMHYYQYLKY